LPAVLEFNVPPGTTAFTLEVGGEKYTQPIPDEDEHWHRDEEDDHDDDEDDANAGFKPFSSGHGHHH